LSVKNKTPRDDSISGPWEITDTVITTRKNLFSMQPGNAHHIATIVSGSRSKVTRFEQSLVLIRAAPDLYQTLSATLEAIRSSSPSEGSSLAAVADEIEVVLARASSSFEEG
jgi:hypothetical protein